MVEKENIPDWGAAMISLVPDARVSGANVALCKVADPELGSMPWLTLNERFIADSSGVTCA